MTDTPDLDALAALEAAATPGPWFADRGIRVKGGGLVATVYAPSEHPELEFIDFMGDA